MLLATAAVGMSACGGDDDDSADSGGGGKGGGELVVASTGLDNADPTLYQTVQANQIMHLVYTPLITYKNEEGEAGTEIIPGLAQEVLSRRTAARPTSSHCARASSTATARPSRPATSRTR